VTILLPPEQLATGSTIASGPTPDPAATLPDATGTLLARVVERLYREYECCLPLSVVIGIVARCVHDIQATPLSALPELTERLAKYRLAQLGHRDR
jgi:hypothetical protein